MSINVKICGLRTEQDVVATAHAGARYIGFVFFPKSPRNLTLQEAQALAVTVPEGICKVALSVDATDADLDQIVETVPLDMLQLQGKETPDRIDALRSRYGLPVMKAVGVATEADLTALAEFGRVADQLLVDAKPPPDGDIPGGNGQTVDWTLLQGRRWPVPWMLAGGLNAANVAEAIRLTGASQVDVSSGVEASRGVKDRAKIGAFVAAAMA